MITLYGIPNCDTVKRARTWLTEHAIPYTFHDFRKHGFPNEEAATWLAELGPAVIVNKQGTTWRALTPQDQARANDNNGTLALLADHPAIVKRPILRAGSLLMAGFKPELYENALDKLRAHA